MVFQVSVHPSHPVLITNLGEDEAKILGQVHFSFKHWAFFSNPFQVEAPQLMLPTMSDSANVKFGGLDENTLEEKVILPTKNLLLSTFDLLTF